MRSGKQGKTGHFALFYFSGSLKALLLLNYCNAQQKVLQQIEKRLDKEKQKSIIHLNDKRRATQSQKGLKMKNELEKLGFTIVAETDNFFYMTLEANEDEMLYNASEEIKENLIYSYRQPSEMGELRDYDYKFPKNL